MSFLVTKYLELLICDFKSKHLDISLSGKINLDHASLNCSVLQSLLGLPPHLRLQSATVGNLVVKIPWNKLRSQPVEVTLSSLSIVIEEPEHLQTNDPLPPLLQRSQDELRTRKGKKQKAATASSGLPPSKRHWYDSIVENFRLDVGVVNLVLRLRNRSEANASAGTSSPFVSVTIDGLRLDSTDADFRAVDVCRHEKGQRLLRIFKRLCLDSFTVALGGPAPEHKKGGKDTSTLLSLPFEARLAMRRCARTSAVAHASLHLDIQQISLDWTQRGVHRFVQFVRGLSQCLQRPVLSEQESAADASSAAAAAVVNHEPADDGANVDDVAQEIRKLKKLNLETDLDAPDIASGSVRSVSAPATTMSSASQAVVGWADVSINVTVGLMAVELHSVPRWNAVVNQLSCKFTTVIPAAAIANRQLMSLDTVVDRIDRSWEEEFPALASRNRIISARMFVAFVSVRERCRTAGANKPPPPLPFLLPAQAANSFLDLNVYLFCCASSPQPPLAISRIEVRGRLAPFEVNIDRRSLQRVVDLFRLEDSVDEAKRPGVNGQTSPCGDEDDSESVLRATASQQGNPLSRVFVVVHDDGGSQLVLSVNRVLFDAPSPLQARCRVIGIDLGSADQRLSSEADGTVIVKCASIFREPFNISWVADVIRATNRCHLDVNVFPSMQLELSTAGIAKLVRDHGMTAILASYVFPTRGNNTKSDINVKPFHLHVPYFLSHVDFAMGGPLSLTLVHFGGDKDTVTSSFINPLSLILRPHQWMALCASRPETETSTTNLFEMSFAALEFVVANGPRNQEHNDDDKLAHYVLLKLIGTRIRVSSRLCAFIPGDVEVRPTTSSSVNLRVKAKFSGIIDAVQLSSFNLFVASSSHDSESSSIDNDRLAACTELLVDVDALMNGNFQPQHSLSPPTMTAESATCSRAQMILQSAHRYFEQLAFWIKDLNVDNVGLTTCRDDVFETGKIPVSHAAINDVTERLHVTQSRLLRAEENELRVSQLLAETKLKLAEVLSELEASRGRTSNAERKLAAMQQAMAGVSSGSLNSGGATTMMTAMSSAGSGSSVSGAAGAAAAAASAVVHSLTLANMEMLERLSSQDKERVNFRLQLEQKQESLDQLRDQLNTLRDSHRTAVALRDQTEQKLSAQLTAAQERAHQLEAELGQREQQILAQKLEQVQQQMEQFDQDGLVAVTPAVSTANVNKTPSRKGTASGTFSLKNKLKK